MCIRNFLVFIGLVIMLFANKVMAGPVVHGVSVVVLDAGHGGNDPGAHYAGVYEKDLTLKVVLRLGKLIEQQMSGVKVVYTRTTDKALASTKAEDLQARADIANRAGGDLFISIHVNAAKSTAAKGVETLVMGESPKEQQYNENALFENNRDDLIDMSDERTAAIVRAYIQNLQFTYGEYSMALARCIQNSYVKSGRQSRGVKPQLLRVLYATDMPGVLTEIGFLSNPQEAAYLKSEKGINAIVQALLQAVKEYSARVLQLRGEAEQVLPATSPETSPKDSDSKHLKSSPIGSSTEKSKKKKAEKQKSEKKPTDKELPKNAGQKAEVLPEAKSIEKPSRETESIHYAVQISASSKVISVNSSAFKNYRGKVKQYVADGKFRYKYCVGEFQTAKVAQQKLREVRKSFSDAFVVRCKGDKIEK